MSAVQNQPLEPSRRKRSASAARKPREAKKPKKKLHPHAQIVKQLGGPTEMAVKLTKMTGKLYTAERVGMWMQPKRGISYPSRRYVIALLTAAGFKAPKNF